MPNQKNIQGVQELKDKVSKAKSIVFADYAGLKANDASEVRGVLKAQGAEVNVAKNTLLKIALKEEKLDGKEVEEQLKGQTVTIFSYEDAVSPIKALFDFAKRFEVIKVKGSFIEGRFADASKTEEVSKLPSKDQLIAQVIGTMKSPLSGFANVIGGVQKSFVYAIKAVADKKQA